MSVKKTDPIVTLLSNVMTEDEIVSTLLELESKYGIRRVLLTTPWISALLTGMPDLDFYREFGERLLRVKNRVKDTDIQVGWWCMPTLETGKAPYQTQVGLNGAISEADFIASCPLDKDFRKRFQDSIAAVARIAKPFVILMEDDFNVSNHGPVRFGCFCPLHLKEFAKRTGREYSREELCEIFSSGAAGSVDLRRQWGELVRDTLADFARGVREKVDEVSPDTRIALCQSGMSSYDGDFTEAVASAFAGNTKPMVRVYGTTYSSDAGDNIPFALFNVLYSKQNLPEHFELVHESDAYPHTRFFMSAAKLKSLMAAAYSCGMTDSLVLSHQFTDNPLEESGYDQLIKTERDRFSTFINEVRDCYPVGCEICHSQWSHTIVPYNGQHFPAGGLNPWIGVLGKLGIPYTVKHGNVKMLSAHYASYISDAQIREMLSGGVMIDGDAACVLTQRGFGSLIGAESTPGQEIKFCFEKIEEDTGFEDINGRLMNNFMFALAGNEGRGFCRIEHHPQAEILTSLIDPYGNAVMPGMIRFKNPLGGRIVTTAYNLKDNMTSSSVFNYRKKEIVRQTLEWAGRERLPVFIKDLPSVFCIMNHSKTDNKAVATLINMCTDTAPEVKILLPDEWNGCRLEILNIRGEWDRLDVTPEDGLATIPVELKYLEPVYIKITR